MIELGTDIRIFGRLCCLFVVVVDAFIDLYQAIDVVVLFVCGFVIVLVLVRLRVCVSVLVFVLRFVFMCVWWSFVCLFDVWLLLLCV